MSNASFFESKAVAVLRARPFYVAFSAMQNWERPRGFALARRALDLSAREGKMKENDK